MAKKTDTSLAMTLSPAKCIESIRSLRATKRAMFLWGAPGISKSAAAQHVATSDNMAFIDVRLSQMDPCDLRGVPMPVTVGNVEGLAWSAPTVFPRDIEHRDTLTVRPVETKVKFYNPKGANKIHYCTDPSIKVKSLTKGLTAELIEKGLDYFVVGLTDGTKDENGDLNLFAGEISFVVTGKARGLIALEEFNSAPQSVQAAAYQLVLDRRLGEYEIPDGVDLMAMGNRDTDKGVTYKMPTPIMNRFVHIEMRVDSDEWIEWALGEQIHPEVVGYIAHFKQHLHDFDPSNASRGFATPRSWHFVSDILYNNEKTVSDEVLRAQCTGSIGEGIGIQFMEFRKGMLDLPKAEDVLSGKVKTMPRKVEVSLAYALTTTMCYNLKNSIDRIKAEHTDKHKASVSVSETKEFEQWLAQADNFLLFIMENFQPEIAIMGAKSALGVHKLPFENRRMKHFSTFTKLYKTLII